MRPLLLATLAALVVLAQPTQAQGQEGPAKKTAAKARVVFHIPGKTRVRKGVKYRRLSPYVPDIRVVSPDGKKQLAKVTGFRSPSQMQRILRDAKDEWERSPRAQDAR